MKEICIKCGMVANLDPWMHESRYGHKPEIIRNGQHLIHAPNGNGTFVPVKEPKSNS